MHCVCPLCFHGDNIIMHVSSIEQARAFLKDSIRKVIDFSQTDQSRGVPVPPLEKSFEPDIERIDLVPPERWTNIGKIDVVTAIARRQSHRRFTTEPLSVEELSFLLWATQGIRQIRNAYAAFRTVPSAGCRHAFETYVWVQNIDGIDPGCYRYLPKEHQLVLEFQMARMAEEITTATSHQRFAGQAAVTFIWSTIPYRMEWRYGLAAHKVIALDAGHVCQNLYLACEAIGAGTCAIAAYDQEYIDQLLRLDGTDEFVVYLAPVGKL